MKTDKSQVVFGVAKELITPGVTTTMMGFASVFGVNFKDIHDDLYARCLLLEDGKGEKIILLGMDLLFHDDSLPNTLRKYAEEKYGVPADNLHVNYSHTHYGPTLKGYDFNWASEEYEEFLIQRLCSVIDRAFLNRRVGTMKYASVSGEWNICRRLSEDGKIVFGPNPDGEVDKNLYMLKFEDEDGKMRALAMSFACHPSNNAGEKTISSEYPGRLCQRVEAEFYGTTALFFQGFGADSKLKIGMKTSAFSLISYEDIDEVALSMTNRIKSKLLRDEWQTLPVDLASRTFKLELPLDINPREYYMEYKKQFGIEINEHYQKQPGDSDDKFFNIRQFVWACADRVLDNYDMLLETLLLNCGAVQINPDFYILSMGGEPGVNIQTVLRESMPDKTLLCFGYNDAIAYIPSDKMIEEGGYEADESVNEYRLKGKVRLGADKIFCDGFKAVIEEMQK